MDAVTRVLALTDEVHSVPMDVRFLDLPETVFTQLEDATFSLMGTISRVGQCRAAIAAAKAASEKIEEDLQSELDEIENQSIAQSVTIAGTER